MVVFNYQLIKERFFMSSIRTIKISVNTNKNMGLIETDLSFLFLNIMVFSLLISVYLDVLKLEKIGKKENYRKIESIETIK